MIIRLKLERAGLNPDNVPLFDKTYIISKDDESKTCNQFFLHDIGEQIGEMQGAQLYISLETWTAECNCEERAGRWYCEVHGHMHT